MDHKKLWKILKEIGIPDHVTCVLRNLYADEEVTVRTGYGTMGWFKIGQGVCQDYIFLPCLFNLYAEYIMWNARLDEVQAGIKTAGRNINSLLYADDTSLMAENEEKVNSLLMNMQVESWKSWLKTQHWKNEDHLIRSHHFMQKIVTDFVFLHSKITTDSDCSHEIKRHLLLGRKLWQI